MKTQKIISFISFLVVLLFSAVAFATFLSGPP